jgi:predicted ester cyclase
MSTKQNKAILRQVYEAAFHQEYLDALDEVIASDSIDHNLPPEQPSGLQGAKQVFSSIHCAFPDLQLNVEDMIAEGDKIVARLAGRGTHQGEFLGIAPTDNQVTITGIDIVRMADGKIVERWGNFDNLGMMQQLGVMEQPSGQPGNPSKGPESRFGRTLALSSYPYSPK